MSATPTYPGQRSNEPQTNNFPARDLAIINQPAGGVEFINTKDDEMVTHYYKDGSYMRFHKHGTDVLVTKDKREHVMGDSYTEVNGNVVQVYDKNLEIINLGDVLKKTGDVDKWQKYQDKIKNLIKTNLHPLKRLFEIKRTKKHNDIDQASQQTKQGTLAPTPSDEIDTKTLIDGDPLIYNVGVKASCDHAIPTLEATDNDYETRTASNGWGEFSGWGTGNSPSSQDGKWEPEKLKDTITQKRIEIQKQLFDNEKHLGQNKHRDGGTIVDKVSKDYVKIVGLSFNNMESFRKDPKGKLVPYGVKIDPFGNSVYTQYRESSLIEHVAVEDTPGGNYNLTVGNEFDIVAGAGGINMKTLGPMELYSPTLISTTEQTMLNTRGEMNIGGERVDISGEIISLRPKKVERELETSDGSIADLDANGKTKTEPEQQVLVDGNLNVTLNAIIAGGMHVEGEVTLHHVTAPLEEQITDGCFEWGEQVNCELDPTNEATCETDIPPKSSVHADILEGCIIGYCTTPLGVFPVISTCAPNSVMVHDHFHYFKNLPLKLFRDEIEADITVGDKSDTANVKPHDAVRVVGARNNFTNRILSKPVKHSDTQETVVEKFAGNICDPLTIDNGDWEEENVDETRPSGEGVRSSDYPDSDLFDKVKALETQLESKYRELQDKLDKITANQ